jgi:hypothetical protein
MITVIAATETAAGSPAFLGILVGAIGAMAGAALTYLAQRRNNSGNIHTATADVLFAQMQHIVDLSQARAEKAEQQRDLLIESQGTKIAPAISQISDGLTQLVAMDKQIAEMVQDVQTQLKAKGLADGTQPMA